MARTKSWVIEETAFPKKESIENQLKFLLRYAILAANSHNSQPWKFEIKKNKITISPDKKRRLPVVDPKDRELWITLGCSLENLILASEHFGFSNKITSSKKGITITFEKGEKKQNVLFEYITKRVTNRRKAKRMKVPSETITQLKKREFEKNTNAYLFEEKKDLEQIIQLIKEANNIQLKSKKYINELTDWMRFNKASVEKYNDGLTFKSMDMPPVNRTLGKAIVKFFLKPNSINKEDEKKIKASSGIILITSKDDSVKEWIKTGRTLQRILLILTSKGISYNFMNPPCEVPKVRKKLEKITKSKPQIILRIGYAKTISHSPRRPLDDVLL